MSLYNMVHGTDPSMPLIAEALGSPEMGRLRDAWVERHGDDYRIVVYTRNGGGNRDCFHDTDFEEGCPGCVMSTVDSLPYYLGDADDDFDCTYASIFFSLPDEYRERLIAIARPEERDLGQEWNEAIDRLKP